MYFRYRHEIAHDGQRIYILGGGTSWTAYSLNKVYFKKRENREKQDNSVTVHTLIFGKVFHPHLLYVKCSV